MCLLPSKPGEINHLSGTIYIYTLKDKTIYTQLYIGGESSIDVAGRRVVLAQKTNYPWDGKVEMIVRTSETKEFSLGLRIPGWCKNYRLIMNGEETKAEVENGYLMLNRTWNEGDTVELILDMPVELMQANPRVRENSGKLAIQRGPLVYCIEEIDNGSNLSDISIPMDVKLTAEFDDNILEGTVVIKGSAFRTNDAIWDDNLYQTAEDNKKPASIMAVPYHLWGNRASGEMLVWIRG